MISVAFIVNKLLLKGAATAAFMGDTVIYLGPVGAGKTASVMNDLKAALLKGDDVAMIKHTADTRFTRAALVTSHDRNVMHAVAATNLYVDPPSLNDAVQCIGIDEGQFFPGLLSFCRRWNARGVNVRVSACNTRADRSPFAGSEIGDLVEWGCTVRQCYGICIHCGNDRATLTQCTQTVPQDGSAVVGGTDMYAPVCARCNTMPLTEALLLKREESSRKIKDLITE